MLQYISVQKVRTIMHGLGLYQLQLLVQKVERNYWKVQTSTSAADRKKTSGKDTVHKDVGPSRNLQISKMHIMHQVQLLVLGRMTGNCKLQLLLLTRQKHQKETVC